MPPGFGKMLAPCPPLRIETGVDSAAGEPQRLGDLVGRLGPQEHGRLTGQRVFGPQRLVLVVSGKPHAAQSFAQAVPVRHDVPSVDSVVVGFSPAYSEPVTSHRPDSDAERQKTVSMKPITRGSSASASSTSGSSRHLSNAVHGCEMPSFTTSPTASGESAGSSR